MTSPAQPSRTDRRLLVIGSLVSQHQEVTEQRVPFDHHAYEARVRSNGCFVCAVAKGEEGHYREHVVYRDDHLIAFLSQPPVQRGYVLVAPLTHTEQVVTGLDLDEYLHIQTFIHHLGRTLPQVLPVERLYILSLGSQQANAHVHWHVVPLPPGVPLADQQFRSVMLEHGYLDLDDEEQTQLAARIRHQLATALG